jgi:hypothetical protein
MRRPTVMMLTGALSNAEPRRRRPAAESLREDLYTGQSERIVSLLRFGRVKQSPVNLSSLK